MKWALIFKGVYMAWLSANWGLVVSILFGLSETLALIPGVQANSVFQLIFGALKTIAGKK